MLAWAAQHDVLDRPNQTAEDDVRSRPNVCDGLLPSQLGHGLILCPQGTSLSILHVPVTAQSQRIELTKTELRSSDAYDLLILPFHSIRRSVVQMSRIEVAASCYQYTFYT